MASIGFAGVTKTFDDGTTAVDALDLEIRDGEFMVLVGPSGSGKSTALRMLAGLEDNTAGSIRIGERVVDDVEPKDRDIAMVFQSYALYPHMTVAENMGFALKMQGVAKAEIVQRVAGAGEKLGITSLLERRPKQLSGGQRQRVALGRAIVRDPAAFLMDEPLSNLDAKLRVEMRAYLATLHQRLQTTTLYVTHDQTEAMTMGDRVAVMRDGRLQQVDSPQGLYDHPVNLFVAGFIGSPAMNLVHSELTERDGRIHAAFGTASLALPDSVLAARPSLRGYVGKSLIAGLRPEDIEDAAFAPSANGSSLDITVGLAESMGAEVIAHFPVQARPITGASMRAVHGGVDGPDDSSGLTLLAADASGEALVTARLNPRSRATTGEPLRVVLDAGRVHFFDAETEASIW
jgi:multiple sugar transport system ATP-binding protein